MAEDTELEAIEKKAWTSMFQDGLWEIIIGFILLASALGNTLDDIGATDEVRLIVTIPMFFMGVPIMYLGKRFITIPRMGVVKFSQYRHERKLHMLLILLAGTVSVFVIWVVMSLYDIESGLLGSMLVTGLILVMFLAIANYLQYNRFYVVAVLVAMGEPIMYWLMKNTDMPFKGVIAYGIPAAIILIMGVTAMAQFVRRHPLEKEEGPVAA